MLSPAQQYLVKHINEIIRENRYGGLTVAVIVKDGEPILKSLNIVIQKRKRYKMRTA